MGDKEIVDVIIRSEECNYDLLPSNSDLTGAEVALMDEIAREIRLKDALYKVRDDYDYVFIDCPPSLNMLTVNALVAANGSDYSHAV